MGKGVGKRIPVNIPSVAGPVNIDTGMLVSVSRSDGHDITTYVLCVSMWYSRELRERRPRLFWYSICTNSFVETESSPFLYTRSTVSNGVDPDELADYLIKDGNQPVIDPYQTVVNPYQSLTQPTRILLEQEGNVWVVHTKNSEGLLELTIPDSLHFSQEEVQLPERSRSGPGFRRLRPDSPSTREVRQRTRSEVD